MATVQVRGLFDLNRELLAASRGVRVGTRKALLDLAAPVRSDASSLARVTIPRIGLAWSQMRVGATVDTVYVAPVQRGRRSGRRKRPNLAPLLLGRAMVPALNRNRQGIEQGLQRVLDDVANQFNR